MKSVSFITGKVTDDFDVLLDQWRSLRDNLSERKLRDVYGQYVTSYYTSSGATSPSLSFFFFSHFFQFVFLIFFSFFFFFLLSILHSTIDKTVTLRVCVTSNYIPVSRHTTQK